jgi:hypothetical protein
MQIAWVIRASQSDEMLNRRIPFCQDPPNGFANSEFTVRGVCETTHLLTPSSTAFTYRGASLPEPD